MWKEMAGIIIQVAALIPEAKRARTDAHEKMRIAVMKAYHSTEAYYDRRHSGQAQNRDSELELAQEWYEAGVLVERFDRMLAERLGKKSLFWRDGGTWSDDQIESAGIGLDRVRQEAMILK